MSRPDRGFVALAAAVAVFHHVPAYTGDAGTWIDLVTPFVVAAAAVYGLQHGSRAAVVLGTVALVLYVDGHGMHLAANAIGQEDAGAAEDAVDFWDEHWGHAEWHLGWLGLLAALSLAEPAAERRNKPRGSLLTAAVLTGLTLFTSTVEGQDWWLVLGAAPLFALWAAANKRRPIVVAAAVGVLLAAALIGVWAAWHGGVPQFSELGWL